MSDSNEKKPSSPAKAEPSYAELFGTMRTLGDLMRDPENRPWLTTMPKEAPHRKYVVWLGCNILRTAHLAEALDDILSHMEVDYSTLGGPSNCCGIVHQRRGDNAVAKNMLDQTMKKFDMFKPEQMLNWCPSCDGRLRAAPEEELSDTAKQRISVTQFLASQADRMQFKVARPIKIAIHYHGGFAEQSSDGIYARDLLSRIPGLTVVDMPELENLGRHCNEVAMKHLGPGGYAAAMNQWATEARGRGATHIVSIYHSCHRHLLLAQRDWPEAERMPVVNYLTVLSEALGLQQRTDKFAKFSTEADVETMMAEVEPNLQANGIKPDQARRALESQFKG
jgi:Fe-S oxidoreductase